MRDPKKDPRSGDTCAIDGMTRTVYDCRLMAFHGGVMLGVSFTWGPSMTLKEYQEKAVILHATP